MNVIYDLLKNKKYDLSIILSEFATKPYVKDFDKSHEYVKCVNKALGYYLNGNKEKCKTIIQGKDWSATELKYRLAVAILNEDNDKACKIMEEIGKTNQMIDFYREWPLFYNFRETENFKKTFKKIYQTEFDYIETKPIKWEDVIKEAIALNRMQNDSKHNCTNEE